MAGNWKMNLTHPEAVALVQKLAWILADKKHDYARTEVVVVPPFTDLRSVQTLVDGDQLAIRYGAQDVSGTTPAPTPARSRRRCWPSSAAPTSWSATPSAGEYHAETDEHGQRQGPAGRSAPG